MRVFVVLLALSGFAHAAEPVTFIACPIYRDSDSGRKSGCWLADDPATQLRYDVSAAPMKPQLGHQVLVEGVRSDDPDACGGVTLRPVRTSELTTTCESVTIPAEGYPGRRFNVPADAQKPTWEARDLPPPPYRPSDFYILFDLNNDFLVYQHAEIVMEKVILYAKASQAREVIVTGFAATAPIRVSGVSLQERPALARSRAEVVALSLKRLGIAPEKLHTNWQTHPDTIDTPYAATGETSKRRVTIRIIPGEDK
jgi:outer membrane protein OmpA-like peptidoglycan-associated protein